MFEHAVARSEISEDSDLDMLASVIPALVRRQEPDSKEARGQSSRAGNLASVSIVSRWPERQEHPVTAGDLDSNGDVSDEALERWVAAACSGYLARCAVLESVRQRSGLRLAWRAVRLPPAGLLGRPTIVVVTASAPEIRPSSFTVAVRVRAVGGDRDRALNAACVVRLEDPATGEVRELGEEVCDELIAIEGSARHFN